MSQVCVETFSVAKLINVLTDLLQILVPSVVSVKIHIDKPYEEVYTLGYEDTCLIIEKELQNSVSSSARVISIQNKCIQVDALVPLLSLPRLLKLSKCMGNPVAFTAVENLFLISNVDEQKEVLQVTRPSNNEDTFLQLIKETQNNHELQQQAVTLRNGFTVLYSKLESKVQAIKDPLPENFVEVWINCLASDGQYHAGFELAIHLDLELEEFRSVLSSIELVVETDPITLVKGPFRLFGYKMGNEQGPQIEVELEEGTFRKYWRALARPQMVLCIRYNDYENHKRTARNPLQAY